MTCRRNYRLKTGTLKTFLFLAVQFCFVLNKEGLIDECVLFIEIQTTREATEVLKLFLFLTG